MLKVLGDLVKINLEVRYASKNLHNTKSIMQALILKEILKQMIAN